MTSKWIWPVVSWLILAGLVDCGLAEEAAPAATGTPTFTLAAAPSSPTQMLQEGTVTPSAPIPIPPGPRLQALVDHAKADLAKRLTISEDQIDLVELRSVVWPDGSLGCPRPGMVYPQVQQDGILIRLRVGARLYQYHGGGLRPPFLCENLARNK